MNNKVIIIGNDHSNTLGVIRAFGENRINPNIYIISDSKNISVAKSKYVKDVKVFRNEENAIEDLIKNYNDEKEKSFLIPTSDKAAAIIDSEYDKISKSFFTQSINICHISGSCVSENYSGNWNP